MTGYPWLPDAALTSSDLNAAFGLAYSRAQAALTAALAAQGLATTAVATLGPPKPISCTLNWPNVLMVNGTYILSATIPYSAAFASFDASTGSAGGSFAVTFRANGLVIGNSSLMLVSSATKTSRVLVSSPTNPLTVDAGTLVDAVIQVTSGSPIDCYVCLIGTRTS